MMKPIPTGQTPASVLKLHTIAADWYVRRQQVGWRRADEVEMNVWLDADPLHREIMDGLASTWLQADQLKAYKPEVYARQPTAASTPARPAPLESATAPAVHGAFGGAADASWKAGMRRRAFAPAFAVACAVIVAAGWYRWDTAANYSLDAATGASETRELSLPDGTQITLNINSTLKVRYYRHRRETVLNQGEAFFQVAADASKPFTVDSGASQVRVVGTAFNVRAAPPSLVVKVSEGRVEVQPDRDARGTSVLVLGPGSGVGIDPSTGKYQSLPTTVEDVGDWRSGQVHFSRAPLAEVAQELSRYLGRPVMVTDATLGSVPISGLLAVKTPENFIQSLPDVAPVRAERLGDGSWRLTPR
ncbi:FecR family protein [Ottowia thiooxydans]|uniref:FecR family protein n=1 Tax=Ottowia thiooxydans TaxID=219182 RepID=UPI000428334B|nr:FecR domain-containing protein [Ottowia thiooxydans]